MKTVKYFSLNARILISVLIFLSISIHSNVGYSQAINKVTILSITPNPIPCSATAGGTATVKVQVIYSVNLAQLGRNNNLPITVTVDLYEDDYWWANDDHIGTTTFLTKGSPINKFPKSVFFTINCSAANSSCQCDLSGNVGADDEHGDHHLYALVRNSGVESVNTVVHCIKPDSTIASLFPESILPQGEAIAVGFGLFDTLEDVSAFAVNINYDNSFFSVDTFINESGLSSAEFGTFSLPGVFQIFFGGPVPRDVPPQIGTLVVRASPTTPPGEYLISIDTTSEFFDPSFNPYKLQPGSGILAVLPNDSLPPFIDTSLVFATDSALGGFTGAITDENDTISDYLQVFLYENDTLILSQIVFSDGSFSFSGLFFYDNLPVKIVATDPLGNTSEYSFIYQSPNCPAPLNLNVTRITPESARLNWLPRPDAQHFQIRGRSIGASSFVFLSIPAGAPHFKDVFGLQNNTSFEWQIRAFCDAGVSDSSEWSRADTFTTGCFSPDSSWTDPVSSTGARLNWKKAFGSKGYEIQGKRVGGTGLTTILINGGNTLFKNAFGLSPNTAYEWRIRSWCDTAGIRKSGFTDLDTFVTASASRMGMPHEKEHVFVYPNPFSKTANIVFSNPEHSTYRLFIYDVTGKVVYREQEINNESVIIESNDLGTGMWFFELRGERLLRGKFLVQ